MVGWRSLSGPNRVMSIVGVSDLKFVRVEGSMVPIYLSRFTGGNGGASCCFLASTLIETLCLTRWTPSNKAFLLMMNWSRW
jgi:hypothetical protein